MVFLTTKDTKSTKASCICEAFRVSSCLSWLRALNFLKRSSLLYWNEQPAGYKTLEIVGEDMPEILTFTNRTGKFVVTGSKPGTYKVKVAGLNEWAQFEVTGDEKLVFAEMIILSDPQGN